MKTRIIAGIVSVAILLPVLIFADYPILPLGIAICSILAVYEMLGCIGLKKSAAISIPFYLIAAAFPFLMRWGVTSAHILPITLCTVVFCSVYLFSVLIFSKGKYTLEQIGICFFTLAYILLGLNAIVAVHDYVPMGEYLYLLVFLGAWVTDIFAYFCGMLFGRGGKHKLCPTVSPKKTVEGSIGGILFCILAVVLFGIIVEKIEPKIDANLWIFAIAGLFISIIAQIGDLALSVVKRTYGIKDYGKVFPGHGGVLDRFDSIIAVSVVLLALTSVFQFF